MLLAGSRAKRVPPSLIGRKAWARPQLGTRLGRKSGSSFSASLQSGLSTYCAICFRLKRAAGTFCRTTSFRNRQSLPNPLPAEPLPTEAGLSLFGVLKQADPALVDPGVTAQLECLLDDVVVGKQEMVSAIDAVCNVAERIIGKLKEGGAGGGPPLLGATVGNGPGTFPPTPAMKRFSNSLARQKGIKPPTGYETSISICRKFLSEHAPKKAEGETLGKLDSKPVSPAQMLYATKIAQAKGVVIPEEAKANSAAMSAWIDFEPKHEAPQARSQDCLQADRVSCASIDGDD